jgi:MFS family permease
MKTINKLKLQIFTNIGAALEYYDYIIFAYLIPILSIVFFPKTIDENTIYINNMQMILLFSIGNLSRISGSFILGFLATKYGKSFVMILSIYLMAISTFTIGLLPSYGQIGLLAPILLLLCRFVQGVAYSVELPSSSMFIFDYFKKNYGQSIGILIASTTLGCVFATFTMYLLTKFFTQSYILDYLWRLPFLIGGIVGIFGISIRKSLSTNYDYKNHSILEVFHSLKKEKNQVIYSISLLLVPASLIIIYIYLEQFFTDRFFYSKSQIYLISTLGLVFSIFCGIFGGIMLDRDNKSYIKYCYYSFFILYPAIWFALYLQSFYILIIFSLIFQFFTTNFMIFALYRMNIIIASNLKSILIIIIYNLVFILCSFIPIIGKNYGTLNIAIGLPYILSLLLLYFNRCKF